MLRAQSMCGCRVEVAQMNGELAAMLRCATSLCVCTRLCSATTRADVKMAPSADGRCAVYCYQYVTEPQRYQALNSSGSMPALQTTQPLDPQPPSRTSRTINKHPPSAYAEPSPPAPLLPVLSLLPLLVLSSAAAAGATSLKLRSGSSSPVFLR